jgi:hypothetical protein
VLPDIPKRGEKGLGNSLGQFVGNTRQYNVFLKSLALRCSIGFHAALVCEQLSGFLDHRSGARLHVWFL